MWVVLYGSVAWPCAGLVHGEGLDAESDAAEVLFEPGEGSVTVSYAATWRGDAPSFGWVIPAPDEVIAVTDGDLSRFDALRTQSQPTVSNASEGGRSCSSCVVSRYGLDADRAAAGEGNVAVLAQGFTGTYDYLVVTATDADSLQAWFDDNGWGGLATEDIAHYVAEGASFVALRVALDAGGEPLELRLLPPVAITYAGDQMVFPAVLARHAAVPTQRTTLYVVGDRRAELSGWSSVEGGALYGGSDADPERVWEDNLASAGRDRKYVRTFAESSDGRWLTRFDTLAPVAVHDIDVSLALGEGTDSVSTEIVLGEDGSSALLLLPLAALGARRRRRVRQNRDTKIGVTTTPSSAQRLTRSSSEISESDPSSGGASLATMIVFSASGSKSISSSVRSTPS